jgi:hypothetical protein
MAKKKTLLHLSSIMIYNDWVRDNAVEGEIYLGI